MAILLLSLQDESLQDPQGAVQITPSQSVMVVDPRGQPPAQAIIPVGAHCQAALLHLCEQFYKRKKL
jgi:hypothetical protein